MKEHRPQGRCSSGRAFHLFGGAATGLHLCVTGPSRASPLCSEGLSPSVSLDSVFRLPARFLPVFCHPFLDRVLPLPVLPSSVLPVCSHPLLQPSPNPSPPPSNPTLSFPSFSFRSPPRLSYLPPDPEQRRQWDKLGGNMDFGLRRACLLPTMGSCGGRVLKSETHASEVRQHATSRSCERGRVVGLNLARCRYA